MYSYYWQINMESDTYKIEYCNTMIAVVRCFRYSIVFKYITTLLRHEQEYWQLFGKCLKNIGDLFSDAYRLAYTL
jgi:hypothetical protein